MDILITGISGNVGSAVYQFLMEKKVPFVSGVRSPKQYRSQSNESTYRLLDLENQATYENALVGIKKVFLVRPPELTNIELIFKPFIMACQAAGVVHIVFLSLLGAEKNPFPPHHKIEKIIEASKISYTFIRPSFFMQNLLQPHGDDITCKHDIFIPSGKAKISFIDTRDIGEIIGMVLTSPGHENKGYTLTGAKAIDYDQVALEMSEVLGKKITYSKPSIMKFRKEMIKKGHKKAFVHVMMALYVTTRLGMAKQVTSTAEELLGRKPSSIRDFIVDYQEHWSS